MNRLSFFGIQPLLSFFMCAGVLLVSPSGFCDISKSIANNFPYQSGIALLDRSLRLHALYPIDGFPSDVVLLPSQSYLGIATQSGAFLILSIEGERIFQTHFQSLDDVDCLSADATQFLLTSRSAKRVFLYNRQTENQDNIPYSFEGPTDADVLPNGNVLVCDAQANRIIEVTRDGSVVWHYATNLKQPMDALRLPHGQTVISDFDHHRVLSISPTGKILKEWTGFDHPRKLTLLPDQSILVADSDEQQIEKITALGEKQTLRDNLNYVVAVDVLPNQEQYLCAIRNKFNPPAPLIDAQRNSNPEQQARSLFPHVSQPSILLILAFTLACLCWWVPLPSIVHRIALLLFFSCIFSVTLPAHRLASSHPGHLPPMSFWLGALLLGLFVYRKAKKAYLPEQQWSENASPIAFPFSLKEALLLILLPFLTLFAQYAYLEPVLGTGTLPWFIPMLVWGSLLYTLYYLLSHRKERDPYAHTALQVGSVTVAIPFTTGSVSLEAMEEPDQERNERALEKRLFDSWANTLLIVVLFIGAALYLIGATKIPTDVHGDEAEVAMYAMQVRDSGNWNFFHPGWYQIPHLFYLIPGWVMWLFGDTLFGVRAAGALIGIASIPFFYLVARRFYTPVTAAVATCLFATSSYFVHFSRLGIGYNQTTLLTLIAVYGFVRGLQEKDARWMSLAGVFSALGFLSYQATKILAPLLLLTLILFWITRVLSWKSLLHSIATFIVAFWVGIAPLCGVYMVDKSAAYSRALGVTMLSREGAELVLKSYPNTVSKSDLAKKQVVRSFLSTITFHDNSPYLENRTYGGILDPLPAILFVAGIVLLAGRIGHPAAQFLWLWIVTILLLGSAMTDHAPSYQRLVGLLPFLILAIAPVLEGGLEQLSHAFQWSPRTRLHVTSGILLLFLVLGMNRYFHNIMSKPQVLDEWTRIARYLDHNGPTYYTYFFGPPHVYFQYGTIRFLAPDARGEDVLKPDQFLRQRILRRGPVCFLLVHSNRRYLQELRRLYPNGREESHVNSEGSAPFTTYVVDL